MNKKLFHGRLKMIDLPNGWRIEPILHPSGDLEVSISNEQGNINFGGHLADEDWEQESFRETFNLVKCKTD
jgi:hypothetical protein|tara:strand:- start:158 stop:370 length:213 start_codon:yes stop_codon:yes gene_type:complete